MVQPVQSQAHQSPAAVAVVVSRMESAAAFLLLAVPVVVLQVQPLVLMARLIQEAVLVAAMEMLATRAQAVQDLSAFATLTLLHSQHQQQDPQQ
jgi:hypothetical protein